MHHADDPANPLPLINIKYSIGWIGQSRLSFGVSVLFALQGAEKIINLAPFYRTLTVGAY
jgi:hypothetical protein